MPTDIDPISEFPETGAPNRDTMLQVEFNIAMANANSWMADLPDDFNTFRAGMLALEENVEDLVNSFSSPILTNILTLADPLPENITSVLQRVKKISGVVFLEIAINRSGDVPPGVIGTLAAGYRPINSVASFDHQSKRITIQSSGVVTSSSVLTPASSTFLISYFAS